jgi:hypothetical protein
MKPGPHLNFLENNFANISRNLFVSTQSYFTSRDTTWLIAIIATGIVLRINLLFLPMRYDESFTFMAFANQGFLDLFYYPLPNNHVLHTLLIRLSTSILGSHPISIRLPAFLAGIASIPLIFHLSRKLLNEKSGFLAALAMSILPYLVFYSTIARGYSLVVLFTLLLLLTGENFCKKTSFGGCTLISIIASLGMLNMPSMLFPIAGIYLWIGCVLIFNKHSAKEILFEFLIPCSILTTIFSIFLYLPSIFVSDGIESIVNYRFVESSPWHIFIGQLHPHFQAIFSDITRDIPSSIQFSFAIILIIGFLQSFKNRNLALFLLLPAMMLGSCFVFIMKHRIPFVRTWIFLIPIALIVADSGLSYIIAKFSRGSQFFYPLILLIFGLLFTVSLISKNAIVDYPDTGHFPEAPIVAKKLSSVWNKDDKIHVKSPADWPLYFYLWYFGIPGNEKATDHDTRTEFYIINQNRHTITEMTAKPVVKLFDIDNAAIYRVLQPDEQGDADTQY